MGRTGREAPTVPPRDGRRHETQVVPSSAVKVSRRRQEAGLTLVRDHRDTGEGADCSVWFCGRCSVSSKHILPECRHTI